MLMMPLQSDAIYPDVASRFQALSDEVQGNKSKFGGFLNLLGFVNNQVLTRKYEIIDGDIE